MIERKNLFNNYIIYLPKLIFFFLLYFLITKESLFTFLFLSILPFIILFFSNIIKDKKQKGIYIALISFILILPISLGIDFLPFGYKYISISLIGSLLYLNIDKSRFKNIKSDQVIAYIFLSILTPITYLSGPSATIKELLENNNNFQLLPTLKSINKKAIYLAISGFFRITLGYYLLSQSDQINSINPFINFNLYFFLYFIIYGFYFFWKYYLLFSGASELCKALLSTIGINVINNFKDPELSIFYHDIWARWHLNITDRIRKYLYTPLTLFALRKAANFNKFAKFIFIEGLPIVTLFLILGIWHGGRPKDYLFGCVSTTLVLISRGFSKNIHLKSFLEKNKIFLEIFRIFNLIIFGIVLSIYEMPFAKNSLNFKSLFINILDLPLLSLILIYFYFRLKHFIFKLNIEGKIFLNYHKLYFGLFELIIAISTQIYFLNDLTMKSDFLYFAN